MCYLSTKILLSNKNQRRGITPHLILTLVTVMKSGPKKTLFTPSISNKTLKQKKYCVIVLLSVMTALLLSVYTVLAKIFYVSASNPKLLIYKNWKKSFLKVYFIKLQSNKNTNTNTTWLKMNIQRSLERESQVSHFLGQVYQGEISSFWGLECLESGWKGVLLQDMKLMSQ